MLVSVNPFNNQQIKVYKLDDEKAVIKKLNATTKAQKIWQEATLNQRIECVKKIAQSIKNNRDALAKMATIEMGKPITQSYMEVDKCIAVCYYYAENIKEILTGFEKQNNEIYIATHYQPLGNILAIMPWNFPYWQVFRNLVPIILGGNAYILKHSNNVYGCANLISKVIKESGLPSGVFQLLYIDGPSASNLIAHEAISAVTFTGSTAIGRIIGAKAGACIKKTVLELGGNDGYGILDDAPIEKAATACAYSRLINNGQSCIAAKRFVVHKKISKQFTELILQKMNALIIGDPLDSSVTLGPLARMDLKASLHKQVALSIKKGAKALNNIRIPKQGAFYAPLVLGNVKKGMPAYEEEFFGPVSSIVIAYSNEKIIETINDSKYGLGAAVFTKNKANAKYIAINKLQAGSCFANDFVRSVVGMPFGGIKQSGYGRELGPWGVLEFMNTKNVYIS